MATKTEKQKAVELALSQIERNFGKGAIMKLGEAQKIGIETIPTGSLSLDIALGGGVLANAILLLFGYGSSACNVYSVEKRMILNNGFHRLYALSSLGITHAPVVVQRVTNAELELPPEVAGLPSDYLVEHPRPVLMQDFSDEALLKVIYRKPHLRNVQIGWNVQQTEVPI